jgi:hypothetical protein
VSDYSDLEVDPRLSEDGPATIAGAPLVYFDRTFRSIGNPLEKGQQA